MPEDDKKQTGAETPAAPAPSGGGVKSWLPLLVSILLMPVLAFGVAQFVILPQLQKGLGIKGSAPAVSVKKETAASKTANAKTESVVMNKLLVNVADTMGARYLLVSVSVVGNSSDFKDKMTEHDAQLRDMACGALATKTLADLEKPDARNLIRNELMTGFNNILGDSMVQDIFFTEFAIQ